MIVRFLVCHQCFGLCAWNLGNRNRIEGILIYYAVDLSEDFIFKIIVNRFTQSTGHKEAPEAQLSLLFTCKESTAGSVMAQTREVHALYRVDVESAQ